MRDTEKSSIVRAGDETEKLFSKVCCVQSGESIGVTSVHAGDGTLEARNNGR